MKSINTKTTGICAGIVLAFCSINGYAAESHMSQALKHAETAAKTADVKTIAEHAEAAKTHIQVSEDHLKAGATSLDAAIEHGKQGHADLAKKSAEEAVTHLKAAQ